MTFNLGMRYEYQKFPEAQYPNASTNFIPNTQTTFNQATSNLPKDKNNFGPRAGFAVGVTEDGKTSLRGGYGLYYGRTINSTIYNALLNTGNPAGQFTVNIQPTAATAPIFPLVLSSVAAGTGAIQYFAPNFGSPMIHQTDLIFEREIFRDTTGLCFVSLQPRREASDVLRSEPERPDVKSDVHASAGARLRARRSAFQSSWVLVPTRDIPNITEIASNVKSEYNALVLQANRRMTKGLQVLASYTLAKAVDDSQVSQTFTTANVPFNVFDPEAERGRSNFDRRHKFVLSAVLCSAGQARQRYRHRHARRLVDSRRSSSSTPGFRTTGSFPEALAAPRAEVSTGPEAARTDCRFSRGTPSPVRT